MMTSMSSFYVQARQATDVLPSRAPMACEFAKSHAHGPGKLDHWEKIELKRIFEMQGGVYVRVGWHIIFFSRDRKMVGIY